MTGVQEINVTVKGGYQPGLIEARVNQPIKLNFTRREASTCGEELIFPAFAKSLHLPEGETVGMEIKPEKPGEYEFTCGMGMYRGKLVVK